MPEFEYGVDHPIDDSFQIRRVLPMEENRARAIITLQVVPGAVLMRRCGCGAWEVEPDE